MTVMQDRACITNYQMPILLWKSYLSWIKEKRKSFVCPVCLCEFVFAGDCWTKTFHNINQGEVCPFTEKEAANQRKKAY